MWRTSAAWYLCPVLCERSLFPTNDQHYEGQWGMALLCNSRQTHDRQEERKKVCHKCVHVWIKDKIRSRNYYRICVIINVRECEWERKSAKKRRSILANRCKANTTHTQHTHRQTEWGKQAAASIISDALSPPAKTYGSHNIPSLNSTRHDSRTRQQFTCLVSRCFTIFTATDHFSLRIRPACLPQLSSHLISARAGHPFFKSSSHPDPSSWIVWPALTSPSF